MSDDFTKDLPAKALDTNPMLERILEELRGMREEMGSMREEMGSMRQEMGSMRSEIATVRDEVASVRREVRHGFAAIDKAFDDYQGRVNHRLGAFGDRLAAVEGSADDA